ncbi:MAG TPA: hypothetical protein DIW77_18490 [Chromatiaceae bacterium]|nr:hypothetical protein [Chromatiaceae bacterium]
MRLGDLGVIARQHQLGLGQIGRSGTEIASQIESTRIRVLGRDPECLHSFSASACRFGGSGARGRSAETARTA